jgi:hypothetical protein
MGFKWNASLNYKKISTLLPLLTAESFVSRQNSQGCEGVADAYDKA